jgi:hypothetical protein
MAPRPHPASADDDDEEKEGLTAGSGVTGAAKTSGSSAGVEAAGAACGAATARCFTRCASRTAGCCSAVLCLPCRARKSRHGRILLALGVVCLFLAIQSNPIFFYYAF